MDGLKVIFARAYTVHADVKSCRLYFWLAECKLVWVQCDAIPTTCVQPLCSLEKTIFNGVSPEEGIVNAFCFTREISYKFIVSSRVTEVESIWE